MCKRIIMMGAMMALLLILTPRALADDPGRLSKLTVRVWPEYDQPTVLVWLTGNLADATNLPREIAVLIPTTAAINAVAWEDPDGTPHDISKQMTNLGDGFQRVTFTLPKAQFRVEYYDDLIKGAPDKSIVFVYKSAAPVDQLTLEVQQPLKATNFGVTPAAQSTRDDTDGLKYFVSTFANVAVNQTLTTQVKYTKTDPSLSFVAVPTPAAAPASPATAPADSASTTSNVYLLFALVVVGVLGVLGVFLFQRSNRQAEPARALAPRRGKRRGEQNAATVFCVQCGHPLIAEDNFCPKCGTKRRVIG